MGNAKEGRQVTSGVKDTDAGHRGQSSLRGSCADHVLPWGHACGRWMGLCSCVSQGGPEQSTTSRPGFSHLFFHLADAHCQDRGQGHVRHWVLRGQQGQGIPLPPHQDAGWGSEIWRGQVSTPLLLTEASAFPETLVWPQGFRRGDFKDSPLRGWLALITVHHSYQLRLWVWCAGYPLEFAFISNLWLPSALCLSTWPPSTTNTHVPSARAPPTDCPWLGWCLQNWCACVTGLRAKWHCFL